MEEIDCVVCHGKNKKKLFQKSSRKGDFFTLVKCKKCGLRYISPRPDPADMGAYYTLDYFTSRTDRGYNDYFSTEIEREIKRVLELNLEDLGFFSYEKELRERGNPGSVLDIGCAAGYSVACMKERGWDSTGVDVSAGCIEFGKSRGLSVVEGDYLDLDFGKKFNLITLWATIEHLHYPGRFLEKAYKDLEDNGMLYLSTCRAGGVNFMRLFGSRWRYYNFPEHLYFFSYPLLKKLLEQKGFKVVQYKTYGSGIGKTGSLKKTIADFMAKRMFMGDMMLVGAKKV
ncbi:MAG: class I SAM-dependent methyltransferase [bacterium]|nr:class I SAM-dependent methyltransferase [bacterium]